MTSLNLVHKTGSPISLTLGSPAEKPNNFWVYVSKIAVKTYINLTERAWRVLSGFEWAKSFHETASLRKILLKLEDPIITQDNLLTERERKVALFSIYDFLGKKCTHQKYFVEELTKRGLFFNSQGNEEDFLHQIRRFNSQSLITKSSFEDTLHQLESYLSPRLLYKRERQLISITQQEHDNINSLLSFENNTVDPTAKFKLFVELLNSSSLQKQILSLDNISPFVIDGTLVPCKAYDNLDFIQSIIRNIPLLQNLPTDIQALNIETATALGLVSLYFVNIIDSVKKEELSNQAKELYDQVKKLPAFKCMGPRYNIDKWKYLESRLQEIQNLREKLERNEKLTFSEFPLYIDTQDIVTDFADFISKHSTWPSPIIKELSLWKPIQIQGDSEHLKEILQKYLKEFRAEVQSKIKVKDLKYVPQLKNIQLLDELSHQFVPFEKVLPSNFLDEIHLYLKMYRPVYVPQNIQFDASCPINICFFKTHSLSDLKHVPLLHKIKALALYLIMPYGHANFSFRHEDKNRKYGLGISVYEGDIDGLGSPRVDSFALNPVKLLLNKKITLEESEQFKAKFYEIFLKRMEKINRYHYYPPNNKNIVKKFLRGFIPSLFADKPEKFLTTQEREMFCSEFVMQTVVETFQKTCKKTGHTLTDSMATFGVNSLKGITPNELRSIWLKQGIIQPHNP